MQQLLQAAAAMQSQLVSAQQELAEAEVEGTAGGGLVTATVNGQGELVDLTIAAAAIDAGDLEETAQTIADLVLAAYRDALNEVDKLQQETMAPLAAGLGGGGGMPDLSAFPGFPGLPGAPAGPDLNEPPARGDQPGEK
jgi:DNA-binding YbaB/EbfC family protein